MKNKTPLPEYRNLGIQKQVDNIMNYIYERDIEDAADDITARLDMLERRIKALEERSEADAPADEISGQDIQDDTD